MNQLSLKERLIAIIQDLPVDRLKDLLNYLEDQKYGYRKYLRKDCNITADYTVRDEKFKDFITNISAGGVYVRTAQSHSPGQEISMDFRMFINSREPGFNSRLSPNFSRSLNCDTV